MFGTPDAGIAALRLKEEFASPLRHDGDRSCPADADSLSEHLLWPDIPIACSCARCALSRFGTHLLIGGVSGLMLARLVADLALPFDVPASLGPNGPTIALAGASALLTTLADIDEPNSWIGRRVRWVFSVLAGLLLFFASWRLSTTEGGVWLARLAHIPPPLRSLTITGVGLIAGGAVVGPWLGYELLRGLQEIFGGHRRMTHSLVTSALLAVFSIVLWFAIMPIPALVVAALLWGQLLHSIGDSVSVGGAPLFWPVQTKPIKLPYALAVWGEPAVAGVALVVAIWLLGGTQR